MKRVSPWIYLVVILPLLQLACGQMTPEEVEAKIASSETLQKIDSVCAELPKPTDFKQTDKRISGNSYLVSIEYRYVSGRPFAVIRDFYVSNAADAGYTITGGDLTETNNFISEIRLERSGVKITVENRPPSAIYSVGCWRNVNA